jgi:enterochelin esterase family protein
MQFMSDFRSRPGRPADQFYVSCGTYEGLIQYQRSIVRLQPSTGTRATFGAVPDGHNQEHWRGSSRLGSWWTAPGSLWMVYA